MDMSAVLVQQGIYAFHVGFVFAGFGQMLQTMILIFQCFNGFQKFNVSGNKENGDV